MDDDTRQAAARAPDPEPAADEAVTGVARGALGTGTALEETQEWTLPDYEPVRPAPATPATLDSALPAAPVAAAPPVAVAPPAHAPAAAPVPAAVGTGHRDSRFGGLPGLAALAILVVMGGAIVLAAMTPGDAPGGLLPGAEATPALTQPAAGDDDDDDEDDDDASAGGDGGGGGTDNKGRGNNNGRGNGGGRGNN